MYKYAKNVKRLWEQLKKYRKRTVTGKHISLTSIRRLTRHTKLNNALLETETEIEDNLLSAEKNFRKIHKFAKDLHVAHFISIDQENARENKTTEDIDKILGNACETKKTRRAITRVKRKVFKLIIKFKGIRI